MNAIPEDDGRNEVDESANRAISYTMLKNKGLTPSRKKELRNPRKKYRNKFVKAEKRRKSQIVEVRREDKRYTGEKTGIRAALTRSVPLS